MKRSKVKILIVDDERTLCETLSEVLNEEGYATEIAFDGKEGLEKMRQTPFDVIFCDLRMPKMDGLNLLKKTQEIQPDAFFIVMTAFGSQNTTLEALKLGAYDYVVKPLIFEDVLLKLKHLVAFQRLSVENRVLKGDVAERFALDNVLGQGTEMRAIYSLIHQVASTPTTILLTGELGVGKEKVAKAIHYQSAQKQHRFMTIRCSSYGDAQLDEALFGEQGIFRRPEGGTLFLDEVSDLSPLLQEKLFGVLSGREQTNQTLRPIVSTTKDLLKEVMKGTFKEELLYRINVVEIKIPPLRARKNDIPFLVKYYVRALSEELGKKVQYVTDEARDILMNYSWKGNIRELQNVLERAILLCGPDTQYLDAHDLPAEISSKSLQNMNYNFKQAMRQYEHEHIYGILEKHRFDKKKAAEDLGLSLSSLYRKIEDLSVPMQ